MNELFQSPDQVHAFVEQDGGRNSYLLHGTPQNIADFLADHDLADRVTLTDTSYELIMSVSGSVIDQCQIRKCRKKLHTPCARSNGARGPWLHIQPDYGGDGIVAPVGAGTRPGADGADDVIRNYHMKGWRWYHDPHDYGLGG